MIMTADFKPASIFNIPSPNERFSLPDEPVTLKSTAISSDAVFDRCTFILTDGSVLGPLESIVHSSMIGSSVKSSSSSVTPMFLIESITLLFKLT